MGFDRDGYGRWNNYGLPEGWQACAWLHSDGQQWMDLGLHGDQSQQICIRYKADEFSSEGFLYGSRGGMGVMSFSFYSCQYNNAGELVNRMYMGVGVNNWNTYFYPNLDASSWHVVIQNVEASYLDGVLMAKNANLDDFRTPSRMLLFRSYGDSANRCFRGNIAGFTIASYSSLALIMDLQPAINTEGQALMYDRVSKKAVINSGYGCFGYELMD